MSPTSTPGPASPTPGPGSGPAADATPTPEPDDDGTREPERLPIFYRYEIQKGDTLLGIAQHFGIDADYIIWNNIDIVLDADSLRPGQTLQIPSVGGIIHYVRLHETLLEIADTYDADINEIVAFVANNLIDANSTVREGSAILVPGGRVKPPTPTPYIEYTVEAGDSFSTIVSRFVPDDADYAEFARRIIDINNIESATSLSVGQVLLIPVRSPSPPAHPTATPSPPSVASGQRCSAETTAAKVSGSIALVITSHGTGTAFYIGDSEWVTAEHVVSGETSVLLANIGFEVTAEVVGTRADVDLAVLSANTNAPALRWGATPAIGAETLVMRYGRGQQTVAAGITRGIVSERYRSEYGHAYIRTDASANPGNSGGPLMDLCGDVIGVIQSKLVGTSIEGVAYALASDSVLTLLPSVRPSASTPTPTTTSAATPTPTPITLSSFGFIWPAAGRMTSWFGRSHPLGIDIAMSVGTPVVASAAGQVTFKGVDPRDGSYGYHVIIRHDQTFTTRYGHLSRFAVTLGEWVEQGDLIGYSGVTGDATEPHLHFEIRRNGTPRNPLNWLP